MRKSAGLVAFLALILGGFGGMFIGPIFFQGGNSGPLTPEKRLEIQKEGVKKYHQFVVNNIGLRGLGHIINKGFIFKIPDNISEDLGKTNEECTKESQNSFKITKRFNVGILRANLNDHGALKARIKIFKGQELLTMEDPKITIYDLQKNEIRNKSGDNFQINAGDYSNFTTDGIDSSAVNIQVETTIEINEDSNNFNLVLDAIDLKFMPKKTLNGYILELIHKTPEECEGKSTSNLEFYNCVNNSNTHHADHVQIIPFELCK